MKDTNKLRNKACENKGSQKGQTRFKTTKVKGKTKDRFTNNGKTMSYTT